MKLRRICSGLYQTPDRRFKIERAWVPPTSSCSPYGGREVWFWGPVVGEALGRNAYKHDSVRALEAAIAKEVEV